MRLDTTYLQYITKEEIRVLMAIEMGMKNHEYVPTHLIEKISKLKRANAYQVLQQLLKNKLIHRERHDYYKLTYLGYDYLALNVFFKRGHIVKVLGKMGVGKESDIYKCQNADGQLVVLKFERLGRTSFRTIKKNRDYLKNKNCSNWLYVSRLASVKEYLYMQILHSNGFPTPKPIDWNRHGVVMALVDGFTLCQIKELEEPEVVFQQCVDLLEKFAQHGLIHSDFNEFNLMMTQNMKLMVIDFPQMVSTSHPNAEFYFQRDQECINTFFSRRFKCAGKAEMELGSIEAIKRLDVEVKASGFLKAELNKKEDIDLIDNLGQFKTEVLEDNQENDSNEEDQEGQDSISGEEQNDLNDSDEYSQKEDDEDAEDNDIHDDLENVQHEENDKPQSQVESDNQTQDLTRDQNKTGIGEQLQDQIDSVESKNKQMIGEESKSAENNAKAQYIMESDKAYIKKVVKKKMRKQYQTKQNVSKTRRNQREEQVEDFYVE